MVSVRFIAEKAHEASGHIGLLSTAAKNQILEGIAEGLERGISVILKANEKDMAAGRKKKLSPGMLDRLFLDKNRVQTMAADVRKVAQLKDFVGTILEERELPNGLFLKRVRVPLGVVGMIYEARPNVTVDAAAICLKSGNAVILKGGSDAQNSNRALVKIIREVLGNLRDGVQLLDTSDREAAKQLMQMHGLVDVIIPRGGASLIRFVRENARVPVIETGASVVHTYVHKDADLAKAVAITQNAKLRRVSICNTLDSLLLDEEIAAKFLSDFVTALPKNPYGAKKLEIRADTACFEILRGLKKPLKAKFALTIKKAAEHDFSIEFLDYVLAVKMVDGVEEALTHIAHHSLKHSEAIVTENRATAERFLKSVDAACVYWNASTQFSDGAQFGLGAEIGISTQKLHVRGPFALEGLTSYKWVIEGNGQVRP